MSMSVSTRRERVCQVFSGNTLDQIGGIERVEGNAWRPACR